MRLAEWNRWTALAAGAVVAVWVAVTGIGGTAVGVLFGLPLVLVLPGLALTGALWPRGLRGVPECVAMAIGLSLALAAVSALALNWVPGGVTPARSTVLLGMVTLLGAGVAAVRRPEVDLVRAGPGWQPPMRAHQAAMLLLALALVGAAVTLAVRSAEQATGPGFTQAWMLPRPDAVAIGLENNQGRADTYRVVLSDGEQTLRTWRDVRLTAGARWSATAGVPAGAGSEVTLRIYRRGDPGRAYRQLHATVTGGGR